MADSYSGLSTQNVLMVAKNVLKFRLFNTQFANKAVHKLIDA